MSGKPFIDSQQATLWGEGSKPRERKPREADPLFDALVYVCKINPMGLTASGRGMLNRALKEIRDVGGTPEQIVARSRAYSERFKHVPTPGALARHWAALETRPQAVRRVTPSEAERAAQTVSVEQLRSLAARGRSWMAERDK